MAKTSSSLWPEVWALIKPRRKLLGFGLVLIGINRLASLVLPASTKYLIDSVIAVGRYERLGPLVLGILAATMIQGVTDYSLTQLLSKSAQRLIAELRRKV